MGGGPRDAGGRWRRARIAARRAPEQGAEADAVSALVNLGWKRPQAAAAVARAAKRLGEDADARMR